MPYRIDVQQGNYIERETIAKLKPGMTRAQVRFILGTPLIADPFNPNRWDYLYYNRPRGRIKDVRRLTLYFEDDRLKRAYADAAVAPTAAEMAAAASAPVAAAAPPRTRRVSSTRCSNPLPVETPNRAAPVTVTSVQVTGPAGAGRGAAAVSAPVSLQHIAVAGSAGRMGRACSKRCSSLPTCACTRPWSATTAPSWARMPGSCWARRAASRSPADLHAALPGAHALIDFTRPEGTLRHLEVCASWA